MLTDEQVERIATQATLTRHGFSEECRQDGAKRLWKALVEAVHGNFSMEEGYRTDAYYMRLVSDYPKEEFYREGNTETVWVAAAEWVIQLRGKQQDLMKRGANSTLHEALDLERSLFGKYNSRSGGWVTVSVIPADKKKRTVSQEEARLLEKIRRLKTALALTVCGKRADVAESSLVGSLIVALHKCGLNVCVETPDLDGLVRVSVAGHVKERESMLDSLVDSTKHFISLLRKDYRRLREEDDKVHRQ